MPSPENITLPPQTEIKREVAPTPPAVEVETEISAEQLAQYIADVEKFLEQHATESARGAEERIESSIKSMDASLETTQATKQEQGLDGQLGEVQSEMSRLAGQAKLDIEKTAIQGEASHENQENGPEKSLQEKIRLWRERVDGLAKTLADLRRESPNDFIEKFNSIVSPEQTKGLEFSLIKSKGEKLLVINELGQLTEIACTAENAAEVLLSIKEADETLRGNSHELRSEIVKRSDGKIKTHEAYTYGRVDLLAGPDVKAFLDERSNWTEERQLLHEAIVAKEMEKAADLSRRLEDSESTIYALRGNTAAGKTTRVKGDPIFQRAIDTNGEPSGAINPDIYKEQLKSTEKVFGREQITHTQAHNEGSMLARRIKSEIAESDSSMIIDQRLNEAKDVTELLKEAERTGKKLRFLDVDSPMETSLIRVLARRPGGADPLPPFGSVAEGYEGVRKNRQELVNAAINNPAVESYVLYVGNEKGESVKVAEKVDGQLKKIDGAESLYDQALSEDTESTVEQLRIQVIDEAYIARARDELQLPSFQIQALEKYRGKTFEEALREHSRKIDLESPTLETYTAAALINLENTSRTARGTVDTSASPDKAQKMQEGLTGESAAELAKDNFREALGVTYKDKDRDFGSASELRQFIESIATTVNHGITKEGVLIRQGADSPKYPYTRVSELEGRMEQFYEELQARLEDPKEDPKSLAAWAEYRIDLSDHFFADGCGKTAKLVSSWIMMRAGQNLPDYTMGGKIPAEKARDEYYANAPQTIPGTDPSREAEELQNWVNYYKKL